MIVPPYILDRLAHDLTTIAKAHGLPVRAVIDALSAYHGEEWCTSNEHSENARPIEREEC